ncbi:hypothetical protein HDU98_011302 [Podochytrium sp. JEL0797]|nr:hypothetical protein HDU98_011302 [Podochytrium sp. JEL0797]
MFAPQTRLRTTLFAHKAGKLAGSTLNALAAATRIGFPVSALVSGSGGAAIAKEVSLVSGVARVLVATGESSLPEAFAPVVASVAEKGAFTHVVVAASSFGKNLLPRVAAILDVSPISDVIDVKSPDTFVRPIYAGNAIATVQSSDKYKLLTVRSTAFAAPATTGGSAAVEDVPAVAEAAIGTKWISEEIVKNDRPELGSAKVVIAGGRGMKNGDNFKMLYDMADTMGGAVGASRAAVDAGFVNNDLQIGQTGKIVAPQIYFAVGISGAIQHLAGMKDSKVIVSINKDPEAPIFQISDYGLVADLFTAIPEITEKLKK